MSDDEDLMRDELIKRLREGSSDLCSPECCYAESMTNAADEIERLRAEITDLTRANGLLHGIVSNREEEISDLRAQLASAITVLEQAQDCIRGETPEDMTDEEAREDTISKIRAIILTDEEGK